MNINEQLANEKPPQAGGMKTATILLGLHKDHSVVKQNVTPAEVQLLTIMHATNNGRVPILDIEVGADIVRDRRVEVARLRGLYGTAKVKGLFGPNTELPQTFRDAIESGMTWATENPETEAQPLVGRKLTADENAAFIGS